MKFTKDWLSDHLSTSKSEKQMIEKLAKQDIDILDTDDSTIRAVFHLHIGDEDLEKIIEVFAQLR